MIWIERRDWCPLSSDSSAVVDSKTSVEFDGECATVKGLFVPNTSLDNDFKDTRNASEMKMKYSAFLHDL
jgi:hypothetical protein